MPSARVSIAHVLTSGVSFSWTHAVAVAQAAAVLSDSNSLLNDAPSLVRSDTCFITTDGEVELPVSDPHAPPDGVLALLREMLAGRDAPPDLVAAAMKPDGLTALLTGFESDDGATRIAELARAAVAHTPLPAPPSTPWLLRRPTEPPPPPLQVVEPSAAAPSASVQVTHVEQPPAHRLWPSAEHALLDARRLQLRLMAAALPHARRRAGFTVGRESLVAAAGGALAVVVLFAAGTLATRVWRGGSSADDRQTLLAARPLPGIVSEFAAVVRPATAEYVRAADPGGSTGGESPDVASAMFALGDTRLFDTSGIEGIDRDPTPAAPAETTSPSATPLSAAVSGDASVGASGSVRPPEGRDAARPSASGEVPAAVGVSTVFSSADHEVSPPVLRGPALPTSTLAPGSTGPADWPYLTVVVDQTGNVEQVRLWARTPRPGESLYRHQMLLAAAKAWRFAPAVRDGRPVRYSIRVPLEP